MRPAMIASLAVLAATATTAREQSGEAAVAAAIGDRVPGPAADCIDPQQVRSTQIVPGTAILYDTGNRLYVQQPKAGAASLRRDEILVSRIEGGRLCRIDSITLVDQLTRASHGFIVLGPFASYGPRRRS